MVMTSAEVLIEQGKSEGLEQGKAEGLEQGKAEGLEQGIEQGKAEGEVRAKQGSVIRLLRLRFPDVPDVVVERVADITDLSRLDVLFEQVFAAATLDDIDLDTQR